MLLMFTLQREVSCKSTDLSLVFTSNCMKIGMFSLSIHTESQNDKINKLTINFSEERSVSWGCLAEGIL